jgi:hypothetical protein
MWRYDLIQRLINKCGYQKYLEIGLGKNCDNFKRINAETKIGIDPYRPDNINDLLNETVLYYEMASEVFLDEHQDVLNGVDIVFIDGLHEYGQVYKECISVMQHLKVGGSVLIHDCNPFTKEMAIPLSKLPEYDRLREPWMGDVWKTIVLLRKLYPTWNIYVADTDCGIGIIKKTSNSIEPVSLSQDLLQEMNNLQYEDLEKDRVAMLNLKSIEQLLEKEI